MQSPYKKIAGILPNKARRTYATTKFHSENP